MIIIIDTPTLLLSLGNIHGLYCMLVVLWVEMMKLMMVLAGKTITQYIQAVAVVYFNV